MIDRCGDPSGTEIVLLVGARPYTLPERCAIKLRDRIREQAPDDRTLGYLADAITEDVDLGECPEPLGLGQPADRGARRHSLRREPGGAATAAVPGLPALRRTVRTAI
jgi:hypothetical protein